ncbi:hypothetical protein B0H66DRAFT_214544 [Apodospora peruviana]|uniref:Uncharacterized protein n=1 Tax=Apodospora peruviana TaxID=516989 RepID=A0AAE0ID49_9PEZI|nr:hypothetical protein B0H66DRAFT_214544 [Apodospora peruviana]
MGMLISREGNDHAASGGRIRNFQAISQLKRLLNGKNLAFSLLNLATPLADQRGTGAKSALLAVTCSCLPVLPGKAAFFINVIPAHRPLASVKLHHAAGLPFKIVKWQAARPERESGGGRWMRPRQDQPVCQWPPAAALHQRKKDGGQLLSLIGFSSLDIIGIRANPTTTLHNPIPSLLGPLPKQQAPAHAQALSVPWEAVSRYHIFGRWSSCSPIEKSLLGGKNPDLRATGPFLPYRVHRCLNIGLVVHGSWACDFLSFSALLSSQSRRSSGGRELESGQRTPRHPMFSSPRARNFRNLHTSRMPTSGAPSPDSMSFGPLCMPVDLGCCTASTTTSDNFDGQDGLTSLLVLLSACCYFAGLP